MSTTQTVLITGVNGFVGQHLARELHEEKEIEVIGVGYHAEAPAEVQKYLKSYIACNLTDASSVAKLDLTKVDTVVHLASLSSPAISFTQPLKTINDNGSMVINLFELALLQKTKPRFLLVSSGAVYDSNQPMPLTESSQTLANSPYVISKLLSEQLAEYYHKRGLETIVVRPFNHTGPGQGPGFLVPDLTQNAFQAGRGGEVLVGNLSTRRDFSDVRDIVRAYSEIITTEIVPHQLYNLCSGKSRSGEEIFRAIAKAMYGNETAVAPKVDPQKLRPYEVADIYGSHALISDDFNWAPKIPLEQTITDYVRWFQEAQQPQQ